MSDAWVISGGPEGPYQLHVVIIHRLCEVQSLGLSVRDSSSQGHIVHGTHRPRELRNFLTGTHRPGTHRDGISERWQKILLRCQ